MRDSVVPALATLGDQAPFPPEAMHMRDSATERSSAAPDSSALRDSVDPFQETRPMHSRVITLILAAGVVAAAAACGDDTSPATPKPVHFTASLTPQGEVGSTIVSSGTGLFTGTLDTVTNVFTYTVNYSGLSSNVTLGHIHGPFTVGGTANSAGVILNFDPAATASPLASGATFVKGATSGSATGTVTLNASTAISTTVNGDSLKKLLLAGKTYANIHTVNNGGGEVRGQVTIVP
jgi:hypothetical protein